MQWDGSPHQWFGPKRPACSLVHATDDATGNALGMLFRPQEDAVGYLKLLDMVLRRHGVPAAVYQDRHSALHRNDNHWSHEEELAGIRFPLTSVGSSRISRSKPSRPSRPKPRDASNGRAARSKTG